MQSLKRILVLSSLVVAAGFVGLRVYGYQYSLCCAVVPTILPSRWGSGASVVLWDGACPSLGDYLLPGPNDYEVYLALYPKELPVNCHRQEDQDRLGTYTPGNARQLERLAGVRSENDFVVGKRVHCSHGRWMEGLHGVSGSRGTVIRVVVSNEPPFEE